MSSLPARPSLEQLRKLAKDRKGSSTLSEAQLAIAREYGFPNWPKLKLAVETDELFRAINDDKVDVDKQMLLESPALSRAEKDGMTPLHCVVDIWQSELVDPLIDAGADLEATYGESAHTPLSWATTIGAFEIASKLVSRGSSCDLFCAAGMGDLELVRGFWSDGSLVPGASKTGSSRFTASGEQLPRPPASSLEQISDALYIAARNGRLEVCRWLLDHGADPDFRGYIGGTCLAWAEFSGDASVSELLRYRGGSDDLEDYEFRATPPVFAPMVFAGWGFAGRLLKWLQLHPGQVDARGGWGTLLNAAAYNGQTDCARVLLAAGADRSLTNAMGATPAEVARSRGLEELAGMLS